MLCPLSYRRLTGARHKERTQPLSGNILLCYPLARNSTFFAPPQFLAIERLHWLTLQPSLH